MCCLGFPFPTSLKTRLSGEGLHTLINGGLFSPNQCGTSQSTPLWSPASSLALFPSSSCRASPQGFKTRLLGKGFHTLMNGGLFSSLINLGHHNLPPFGAQRPRCHSFLPPVADTLSFLQSMWDHPQIHHLLGLSFLLAHCLVVTTQIHR